MFSNPTLTIIFQSLHKKQLTFVWSQKKSLNFDPRIFCKKPNRNLTIVYSMRFKHNPVWRISGSANIDTCCSATALPTHIQPMRETQPPTKAESGRRQSTTDPKGSNGAFQHTLHISRRDPNCASSSGSPWLPQIPTVHLHGFWKVSSLLECLFQDGSRVFWKCSLFFERKPLQVRRLILVCANHLTSIC